MKKISLSITKCTNKKCGFNVITEARIDICPLCKSKMVKQNNFKIQGLLDENTDESFITFKKRI